MASQASFLIRSPAKIDTIEMDATLTESHNGDVDVTEHPVEQGANISDHARAKPPVVTIEGIITNTPLSRGQQARTVSAVGYTFKTSASAPAYFGQPGYAEQAAEKLIALKDAGKMITLTTKFRTYDRMIITSLVIPRNAKIGDAVKFTATLRQIKVVQNKLVATKQTTDPKGKGKTSTGKQTTKKTDDPTQKKSVAFQIAEELGLLDKLGIKK